MGGCCESSSVCNTEEIIDTVSTTHYEFGYKVHTAIMTTQALKQALNAGKYDAVIGGARRDEEKSRAKERIFSFRDKNHTWDPKNQRPELWNVYNTAIQKGESVRVFPISNWTELDVWNYLAREKVALPSLYFAHERECFVRENIIYATSDFIEQKDTEQSETMTVRYRTIGDMTCTGAMRSEALTIKDVLAELKQTRISERGTRSDDKRSESALEDRKRNGYF